MRMKRTGVAAVVLALLWGQAAAADPAQQAQVEGGLLPAATIGEILQVRLERPRERVALAHNALYTEYRTSVLEFLYHRQAHPVKEAA